MSINYLCEGSDCSAFIPEEAYDALVDWRDDNDNDDLYIVCKKSAEGFEVLRQYGDHYIIRDSDEQPSEKVGQ